MGACVMHCACDSNRSRHISQELQVKSISRQQEDAHLSLSSSTCLLRHLHNIAMIACLLTTSHQEPAACSPLLALQPQQYILVCPASVYFNSLHLLNGSITNFSHAP